MAVALLAESVRSLRRCVPDSEDGSIEDADSLVADICQIGLHEIDEKDIGALDYVVFCSCQTSLACVACRSGSTRCPAFATLFMIDVFRLGSCQI